MKDLHRNAVALYEASTALEQTLPELTLPENFAATAEQLRALADEKLSDLEFTFARDLRAAFQDNGIELSGPPHELIADLFVLRVDMRRRLVDMTFSRQPVSAKKIKLDVAQVVTAYERAWRDICERKVDLDKLLAELYEACGRVLKLSGKTAGTRTSLLDVYRELIMVRQPAGFRKNPSKNSFANCSRAKV